MEGGTANSVLRGKGGRQRANGGRRGEQGNLCGTSGEGDLVVSTAGIGSQTSIRLSPAASLKPRRFPCCPAPPTACAACPASRSFLSCHSIHIINAWSRPPQIPVLPGAPDGLCRLPGLRFLALNSMGLAAWPLPPAANALPNLQELQVGRRVEHGY